MKEIKNKNKLSFDEILEKACCNPLTILPFLIAFFLCIPISFISYICYFVVLIIKALFFDFLIGGVEDDKNDN